MTTKPTSGKKRSGKPGTISQKRKPPLPEITHELIESEIPYWNARNPKDRQKYIERVLERYDAMLEGFVEQADLSVNVFNKFTNRHRHWRFWLIVFAGGLAIINIFVANLDADKWKYFGWLTTSAAVYAALLAILSTLENFYNYLDRSQGYRESRELAVDSYRHFQMLWYKHVVPFSDSSEACVNASELYRMIVEKDAELRRKVKELTQIKASKTGGG